MRVAGFAAAFFVLASDFCAEAFLAGRSLAVLRTGVFAALARWAFGLEVLAFITRFAVFADARLAVERDVDRRKPFVRLLLMLILKRAAQQNEQPQDRAEDTIALLLNQRAQVFAGALRDY